MTWPSYIENHIEMRHVIMKLNCTTQIHALEQFSMHQENMSV